jgi:alginate O-acetyltransferase complex protein AlgJ
LGYAHGHRVPRTALAAWLGPFFKLDHAPLDLGQALIGAKKIRVDYLQTDTHWNAFGAFGAYRAVVQALGQQIPGLEPLPPETYDWKTVPSAGLEMARRLGIPEAFPENYFVAPVPIAPVADAETVRDPARLPKKRWQESSYTRNTNVTGKTIVFCDSFTFWYSFKSGSRLQWTTLPLSIPSGLS